MLSKRDRDFLTPHKISIVLLIEKYSTLLPKFWKSDSDDSSLFNNTISKHSPADRKATCVLIARLLQASDMPLAELIEMIEESHLSSEHVIAFKRGLHELHRNGIESFLLLFDLVEVFSSPGPSRTDAYPCLWISLVGIHLRQINLAFRKLSFSLMASLYQKFLLYYEQGSKEIPSFLEQPSLQGEISIDNEDNFEGDIEMEDSLSRKFLSSTKEASPLYKSSLVGDRMQKPSLPSRKSEHNCYSLSQNAIGTKRQAELFIQEQIGLLLMQSPKALHPKQIQEVLLVMLKNCPDLGKGHFLSYLNCLQVREYTGALHSLVRAYDDSRLMQKDTGKGEDISRSFRYASLSMAALQSHFNHRELALKSLEEAIRLSQESSDHVCLQYALAWLYSLTPNQKMILMKRSHTKSNEMNLGYLSWLGLLNYTVELSSSKKSPSELLKKLLGSFMPLTSKKLLDGGVQGQAGIWSVQAALWSAWGNLPLVAICSQMVIHMNSHASLNSLLPSAENSTCTAFCNLALLLANLGDFSMAHNVISHVRDGYPSPSQHYKYWTSTHAHIHFQELLLQGFWSNANSVIVNMANMDPNQASLLKAKLHCCRGEYSQAIKVIDRLKRDLPDNFTPDFYVHLLISEAESLAGGNNYGDALAILVKASSLSHEHHLEYLAALVQFYMASIQMHLGFLKEAQFMINKALNVIRSRGRAYDKARAELLLAKLKVKMARSEGRMDTLLSSVKILKNVQALFEQLNAFPRLKETIYLIVRIYHEAGLYEERNKCALEFRQFEQQHPCFTFTPNTGIF